MTMKPDDDQDAEKSEAMEDADTANGEGVDDATEPEEDGES